MKRATKTGRERPTLAAILPEWRLSGWPAMMGRQPTADDLIVPLPADHAVRRRTLWTPDGMRDKSYCFKRFRDDLGLLRCRHRRGHDLRRTRVSLTREDGARKDILEFCTHNPQNTRRGFQRNPRRCAVEAPGVEHGSGKRRGGCGSDPERRFGRGIEGWGIRQDGRTRRTTPQHRVRVAVEQARPRSLSCSKPSTPQSRPWTLGRSDLQ